MYRQGRLDVTNAELELINNRIRVTLGLLDKLIADRRHLRLVPDPASSADPPVADGG